jgi:hypothetical protein
MPLTVTEPLVGSDRPATMRMVVVLPAPFGPRNPKIAPAAAVRLSPSTAVKSPYLFVRSWISIIPDERVSSAPATFRDPDRKTNGRT